MILNCVIFNISQGYADGNRCALWIRSQIQHHFFCLGCGLQLHCGKVIFLGLLLFSLCCVGLKTAYIESDIEKLWVEGKFQILLHVFQFLMQNIFIFFHF